MRPLQPDQRLWYRRNFAVPNQWQGQRILLHFGAVDWQTTVYLNGRELGSHRGGYDPFTFDITGTLKSGESQELLVAVWDPTDTSWQLRGKQVLASGRLGLHGLLGNLADRLAGASPAGERRVVARRLRSGGQPTEANRQCPHAGRDHHGGGHGQ